MVDSKKRKEAPGSSRELSVKRSKGGTGGKWKTPNQLAKGAASRGSGKIEPGDVGIWATCARNQEGRATEELKAMFVECAERFYGIVESPVKAEDEELEGDIESSIRKEVDSLETKPGATKLFSPVHLDIVCVLFFKLGPQIDPVDFVHRICEEIVSRPGVRRMRYINRLTPVSVIEKATVKGLGDVGLSVLGKHFELSQADATRAEVIVEATAQAETYAIRPTIRNHNTLERDAVIKQVAAMVGDKHKVNLTKPDKVIIVEIYQTICGMSVVGSDWEMLKRFNLSELYQLAPKSNADSETNTRTKGTTVSEPS